LALPEDDLSVIENVSEDDKSCRFHAWMALVDHFDDGIYRLAELFENMEKPQEDGKSGLQYMNRLVRLQPQLARMGEDVHDRRVIMYLLKKEYHSITDT
jgi:hypothetical protein